MEQRAVPPGEDPVCGMVVVPSEGGGGSPRSVYEDREYSFCSMGCLLAFRDDPAWFLDPAYIPTMA